MLERTFSRITISGCKRNEEEENMESIMLEEIKEAVRRIKNGKAHGHDGIAPETIK